MPVTLPEASHAVPMTRLPGSVACVMRPTPTDAIEVPIDEGDVGDVFVSIAYLCWAYRRRGVTVDMAGNAGEWLY